MRDMARRRTAVVQAATGTLLSLESMMRRHTGQTLRGRGLEDWTLKELWETFSEAANYAACYHARAQAGGGAQDGAHVAGGGGEGASLQAGQGRVLRVARRRGVQRTEDV